MKNEFRALDTLDCGLPLDLGQNLGLSFHVSGEEFHLQPHHAELKQSPSSLYSQLIGTQVSSRVFGLFDADWQRLPKWFT